MESLSRTITRVETAYNSSIRNVDERLYNLLEKSPRFFLSEIFRNTLPECLLFDEFL